jgi:hypothetical protein
VSRFDSALIVPDVGEPERYPLDDDPVESRPVHGDTTQGEMRRALDQTLDQMRSHVAADSAPKIDPKLAARLRQLGYLP